MYCNASATLYHEEADGKYTTTYFPSVFWSERANASTSREGMTRTEGVTLRIATTAEIVVTSGNDFFVKGRGGTIDNTSEATIASGIKALGKIYTISSVADKRYGSPHMQHYEFALS